MCFPKNEKANITSQILQGDIMPNLDMFNPGKIQIGGSTSMDRAKRGKGIKQLSIAEELKGRTSISPVSSLQVSGVNNYG